jgi:molybdate transport system substrate-binding protein
MSMNGISSMATRQVLNDLASAFEAKSGERVAIESVGGVAALKRIEEGEAFDIVVLASNAIDRLAASARAWPSRWRRARRVPPSTMKPPCARPCSRHAASVIRRDRAGFI